MVPWFPLLGLLLVVAGCGEPTPRRVVPVTPTRGVGDSDADAAHAVTRPPRAIATH